jgi:hypothetical protein
MELVAVKSGKGVLEYKGQPSFYMGGQNYVPLQEFTQAFHIQYQLDKDRITFTRGQRSSSINKPSSQLLTLYNQTFIPLGQWNKDMGLKVSETKGGIYNRELIMSDEEKGTELAMAPKDLPFRAYSRRMESVGDGYQLDKVYTSPVESSDTNGLNSVVLNFDGTLTYESPGEEVKELWFTSQDFNTVIGTLPVSSIPEKKWGFTTTKIPANLIQDGIVNVLIPGKKGLSTDVYSLKLPAPFDKNKFE